MRSNIIKKFSTDERLMLQKLKNYKLLFFIQTFLIIIFLIINLIKTQFDISKSKELLMIFLITIIFNSILEMSVSKDLSDNFKKNIKSVIFGLLLYTLSAMAAILFFVKEINLIALGIILASDLLIFVISYFVLSKDIK